MTDINPIDRRAQDRAKVDETAAVVGEIMNSLLTLAPDCAEAALGAVHADFIRALTGGQPDEVSAGEILARHTEGVMYILFGVAPTKQ